MKTLLIYLKARLTGEKISWTDAKYRGLHISTETYISRKFDETAQFGGHVGDTIKAFWAESVLAVAYGIGYMKSWSYGVLMKCTVGRFVISLFRKEQFDTRFIVG